jgi:AcrR family transcriptional regulator
MTPEARREREARIAEAALGVLSEKGFAGLSMLAVARRARASNETLYRWYGDKSGLLRALIARDAADLAEALDAVLMQGGSVEHVLEAAGLCLLERILSPRSLALMRAAVADAGPGDTLGTTLVEVRSQATYPRLLSLFTRLKSRGQLRVSAADGMALWLDLLFGHWELACAMGAMAPPEAAGRAERVRRASGLVVTDFAR